MSASQDGASAGGHTPVLYQNVLSALNPRPAGRYIDGTVGAGGHAFGILERSSPDGTLLGLDLDPHALDAAARKLRPFEGRFTLAHASYVQMSDEAHALGWESVNGVLLDLGLSSRQLDEAERGFSFRRAGPLDMRFNPQQTRTADDLVNHLSAEELADILQRYGEERRALRIARAIVAERPISDTLHLAQVVARAIGRPERKKHPATRTFQALRIAVNDELANVEAGLEAALGLLAPGGRLVVIAFHSLEDRLVKRFMRREATDCLCPPEQLTCTCGHEAVLRLITKRPIRPSEAEIERNPRARSARLRVAERLEGA